MTNYEYLKTLDKEGMAEFIDMINCCGFCSENDKGTDACDGKCKRHASEWLKLEKQIKIKDCPFCGSIAIVEKNSHNRYFVVCEDCGCRTNLCISKEHAIELWNGRK